MRLAAINRAVVTCTRCPRLRSYCQEVAQVRRAAYRQQEYHGLPVPSFGDPRARLLIVGLAPAAHGANRTGRPFTGDRSGDFLYAALHRAGFANQPRSTSRDDGMVLKDCYIGMAVHCAPPGNKPDGLEIRNCLSYLAEELSSLARLRVVLALGKIAFDSVRQLIVEPSIRFAHGAEYPVVAQASRRPFRFVASYHVSQQNTFTGRLTESMFDAVLARCRAHF